MTFLKKIATTDLGPGEVSKAEPEKLISGDPTYTLWEQDVDWDGKITSGVWQSTPGVTRTSKSGLWELCTLLEGSIELTEEGQAPVVFRAGDTFVMKPGFKGVWKTLETVRKIYVIVE